MTSKFSFFHHPLQSAFWSLVFNFLLIWFIYKTLPIWSLVFISFLLMTAFSPITHFANKHHLPLLPTMLVIYLFVIFIFLISLVSLVPEVIKQTNLLINNLPGFISQLNNYHLFQATNFDILPHLTNLSSQAFKLVSFLLSNLFNLLIIFFLSYYLTLEKHRLPKYLSLILNKPDWQTKIASYLNQVEHEVGSWVRGELFLMFIIGFMSYIGFSLLSLPYALPLAVIAGSLELIPNLGPTLAALPAIFIGFTISPLTALGTFILTVLIQQLENNLIVPQVMKKAVGLSPLLTILLLLIGYHLGSVLGAIFAIPLFISVRSLYNNLTINSHKGDSYAEHHSNV